MRQDSIAEGRAEAAPPRSTGPGHFGLLDLGDGVQKFSCHYEADLDRGGISVLDIRPLLWRDGWPVAGDVVNEAIDEDGSLRKAPWRDGIGDDYVAKAFEFAHEADPGAELYYNDYNLEKPAKRARVIRLVKDLQKRGLRIDGIGNQGHWQLETPTIDEIEQTLDDLHNATGLKVMYTELDINMLPPAGPNADPALANPYTNGLPGEKQQQLARRYADIFGVMVKHRDWVSRVTFWGLSDADSWLNRGRMNYPLLWDRQRQPKPAFQAIVDVLRRAR